MDKSEELKIIEDMQAVVAQMKADDIEENPDCEFEIFDCQCCGEAKPLAGSVVYDGIRYVLTGQMNLETFKKVIDSFN